MGRLNCIITEGIQSSKEVSAKMANQVGKRYVCKKCGAELVVTRGGNGTLQCCGQPMELKK
jgi:desulfoferrodoxin-like iron-binding protein